MMKRVMSTRIADSSLLLQLYARAGILIYMHHANLIVGSASWGIEQIHPSDRETCADVSRIVSERLSIDEARALIYEAGLRPVSRAHRSFIIQTEQILAEAQNALLKLFEEPNAHTVFYLIIPREDILLPTLRSRMFLLAEERSAHDGAPFAAFLKHSYAQRLEEIANRLKAEDSAWVRAIVVGFSHYAHSTKDAETIRDALMLETHIHTNGSAKKMLLEHVALSLA